MFKVEHEKLLEQKVLGKQISHIREKIYIYITPIKLSHILDLTLRVYQNSQNILRKAQAQISSICSLEASSMIWLQWQRLQNQKETLIHWWQEHPLGLQYSDISWRVTRILNGLMIVLLEYKTNKRIDVNWKKNIYTAKLLVIVQKARIWKELNFQMTDEWIKMLWDI